MKINGHWEDMNNMLRRLKIPIIRNVPHCDYKIWRSYGAEK